ncbi:hypothetical protein [Streptomyces noursei]
MPPQITHSRHRTADAHLLATLEHTIGLPLAQLDVGEKTSREKTTNTA